jgi:hypothetical protein
MNREIVVRSETGHGGTHRAPRYPLDNVADGGLQSFLEHEARRLNVSGPPAAQQTAFGLGQHPVQADHDDVGIRVASAHGRRPAPERLLVETAQRVGDGQQPAIAARSSCARPGLGQRRSAEAWDHRNRKSSTRCVGFRHVLCRYV